MRYIGIELEFIIDNLNCFEKNLKDKNIPYIFVNIKRKNQLFDIFKLIKDNSIKAGKRESIEINTPIMDLSNITRFKEFLSSLDLNTIYLEDSCAFHLHIDCRNVGREKIENLFVFFKNNEEIILKNILEIQNKQYVKPFNDNLNKYTLEDFIDNKIPKKVNLNINCAFKRYKTVEFRCMFASKSIDELEKLINFCLDIFEYGLNNREKVFNNLNELLKNVIGYRYYYTNDYDLYQDIEYINLKDEENVAIINDSKQIGLKLIEIEKQLINTNLSKKEKKGLLMRKEKLINLRRCLK